LKVKILKVKILKVNILTVDISTVNILIVDTLIVGILIVGVLEVDISVQHQNKRVVENSIGQTLKCWSQLRTFPSHRLQHRSHLSLAEPVLFGWQKRSNSLGRKKKFFLCVGSFSEKYFGA
jgi:hypothetical protein